MNKASSHISRQPVAKLTQYSDHGGWGGKRFAIEIDGQSHSIIEKLIYGKWAPEGSYYIEQLPDGTQNRIYDNFEEYGKPNAMSSGHRLKTVSSPIEEVAIVAKILEGKEIVMVSEDVQAVKNGDCLEAIVYPFVDLDWEIAIAEKNREINWFEKYARKDLEKYGFQKTIDDRWIKSCSDSLGGNQL